MKNNHEIISVFITQALQACSYDSALAEVKSYLGAALQALSKTSKKRGRAAATQQAVAEAKKKHEQWWAMLKKNAKDNFDLGPLDNV
jgi:hypothetical protein